MKPMFRLLCLCLLLLAIPGEAWARGASSRGGSFSGGGSSGRSSSSSSSSSSGRSSFGGGSSSGGSSWGSSTRSSGGSSGTSSSSWGSSSRFSPSSSGNRSSSTDTSSATQRSAPSSSATDAALARKVGQGGSKFSSRSAAVSDFQQKYASQYPSTFSSQPGARPSYIPQTTVINGGSYPVFYDSSYGGYGSMIGGHWTAYNVMRDALMLNALMGHHNYYYGGGYNDPGYGGRSDYYGSSPGGGGGGIFVGLVFIIILVIIAVVAVNYLSSRKAVSGNPFGAAASNAGGAAPPPLRNLKTSPMDKSKAADWLAVKPNSVVTISDAQGIADSMKRGQGVRGIDYTVRSIGRLMQIDGLSTHLFFTLHDEEQVTYLLVKIVDELIDLGLYFEVDGLQPGTRQEMVDRGALWLFQQPANPNNFQIADLQYTTTIRQTLPKTGGGSEEVVYELKAQGELQCNYTEQPPRSGMAADALATVVEYQTGQPVENPEFLILEIGEKRGPNSYLQFFLGCPIKFSEVDILPV